VSGARPERVLRLAHAAAPRPIVVQLDDADGAPHADALVLVRSARGVAPANGPGKRIAVHLAVRGLAVRYLHRLLEQAAGTGWDLEGMAAFAAELERRCTYLIASGARLPIHPAGGRRSRHPRAALWRSGRWSLDGGAVDLAGELVAGARARDDALLAAVSGSPHRRAARRLEDLLRDEGITVHRAAGASEIGASWVVEVLAVPRLTTQHLSTLRERFATAPRCEWCGLPVIGARCRRCAAGALR
jgi:hypothetical protein